MGRLDKEARQTSEEVTFKVLNEAEHWAARSCGEKGGDEISSKGISSISSSAGRKW